MEGPKSAYVDVETLPTENIDHAAVYRITETFNEPSAVYYYLPAMEQEIGKKAMTIGEFFQFMYGIQAPDANITIIDTYTEVDELPNPMDVVGEDAVNASLILPIYILKSTGIGYISNDGDPTNAVSVGQGLFGDATLDKGYIDSVDSITEKGCYTIRGANYFIYHLWVYNEEKWFELINTLEVTELPIENIELNVCYILTAADGKKQYFVYNNSEWVEYSSGGGEDFINYISGIDVETFEVPKNITNIAPYAFYGRAYKAVIIPNTVQIIGENAFGNCAALTDVYFTGTEDEWNAITVAAGNEPLVNATKTYDYNKNS